MAKIIQLCATKQEIVKRLALCFPSWAYRLEGRDMDYTLTFSDMREEDELLAEELFQEEAYGNGELTLAETLVDLLDYEGLNIALAESCTGGLASALIISVPGASNVFYEGIVAYSNNSKIDRLAVEVETLRDSGAVSQETAIEMANGLLASNIALAVSITGVAGPQGGTNEKPVGLVYIAAVSEQHTDIHKNIFDGDRNSIRRQAANMALFYAVQHIKNHF
ncbi:MAG: nicotinamide-nucleotide amidohydrolase family protein [Clostridia bacterium]